MAKKTKTKAAKPQAPSGIDAFMAALDHPLKLEIASVSALILAAAPGIKAAVKWNAPSFRTTEFFATVNLRSRDQVQLVFHLGAKVRAESVQGRIADPAGLLKWRAKDRALVTVGTGKALELNRKAFMTLVRQWIAFV